MDYSEQLKDGRWQGRRLRIMERDGFACVKCRKTGYLQIHHKQYNGKAWQAPDDDLVTLCNECHHKEHFKPYNPTLREVEMLIAKCKRRIKKEKLTRLQKGNLKYCLDTFRKTRQEILDGKR